MKRALLLHAKHKFREMKSCQETNSTLSSQLAAPISPTPHLIIEAFLPLLELTRNSLLVDLGCGDGRWLIAANDQTQCRCLGIDVDEERLQIARECIRENELGEQVQVRNQDIFDFVKERDDVDKANVIILYLFREAMTEMGMLLQRRLLSGGETRDIPQKILSVGFALPGWRSAREEKINGIRVYMYAAIDQQMRKNLP